MPIDSLPTPRELPLDHGHCLAWHEVGPADAPAVLLLHGGPGGRTRAQSVAWFDGLGRRVVAHDQRGCGASTPAGLTAHNTLSHLVADIERLREHLGLARWAVAGGSWGALLAIAYAAAHPQRVAGLFLRSSFLARPAEVAGFFAPWAGWLGTQGAAWLGAAAPAADPVRLLQALDADPAGAATAPMGETRRRRIAAAWGRFEAEQSAPGGIAAAPGARFQPPAGDLPPVPPGLEIQRHYLAHGCFVDEPRRIAWLERLARLPRPWPVVLVHGLADATCPVATSRELAARWPGAELEEVPDAGHAMDHPALQAALERAAARWIARLDAVQGDAPALSSGRT